MDFGAPADTTGGDTNGDGTTTTPAKGDWGGIQLSSGASATLDHVDLRYASSPINAYRYQISLSLTDSQVSQYCETAVSAYEVPALTITGNSFTPAPNCPQAYPTVSVVGTTLKPELLEGNTVTGAGYRAIYLRGTLAADWSVPATGTPFVIGGSTDYWGLTVPATRILTLPAAPPSNCKHHSRSLAP